MAAQTLLLGLCERGWNVRCIAPTCHDVEEESQRFDRRYPQLNVRRYRLDALEIATDAAAVGNHRREEKEKVQALLHQSIGSRRPDLVMAGRETFAWYVQEVSRSNQLPCCQWFQGATTRRLVTGGFPLSRAAALIRILKSTQLRVVVARHMAEALAELEIGHCHVIPNGINLHHFRPRPTPQDLMHTLRIEPDQFIVGHISNLKGVKRPQDVVRAIASAQSDGTRMVFLCVGEGQRQTIRLKALCARKGVESRFPGWVARERIPDFLNLADVIMMPSVFEGHPLVFLETMACARVLVASDIPASRNIARDGWDACLFPPGDVPGAARILRRLAGNPSLRNRIGRQARQSVQQYTQSAMVNRYDTLFAAFLGRHLPEAAAVS